MATLLSRMLLLTRLAKSYADLSYQERESRFALTTHAFFVDWVAPKLTDQVRDRLRPLPLRVEPQSLQCLTSKVNMRPPWIASILSRLESPLLSIEQAIRAKSASFYRQFIMLIEKTPETFVSQKMFRTKTGRCHSPKETSLRDGCIYH